MQRWSDLTPDEQARYADREQLLAQLAAANEARQQLQDALHVRDTQLAAVTAERDDYRSRFRDLEHELQLERGQVMAATQRAEAAESALALATNSTPGKGTGVWMPLDKWTEIQAQLAAVPIDTLRRVLFTGYRTDTQITADADAINNWLQPRE